MSKKCNHGIDSASRQTAKLTGDRIDRIFLDSLVFPSIMRVFQKVSLARAAMVKCERDLGGSLDPLVISGHLDQGGANGETGPVE
jgi:hypothetical protein